MKSSGDCQSSKACEKCRLDCRTQNIAIVYAAHNSHAAITESVILPIAHNSHWVATQDTAPFLFMPGMETSQL